MKAFFTQLLAQWKLFIREKVNWYFAALTFFLILLTNPISEFSKSTAFSIMENSATYIAYVACLLFVSLYLRFFLKEVSGGYAIQWSRNRFSDGFVTVKALVGMLGFMVLLLPAFGWVLGISLAFYGTAETLTAIKIWLLFLLPTAAFIVGLSSLLGLLIRRVEICSVIVTVYLAFLLTRYPDAGNLLIFVPSVTINSPLISFGPEMELLIWHQAFYIFLALVLLTAAQLLANSSLPRVRSKQRPVKTLTRVVFLCLTTFLLVLSVSKVSCLQTIRSMKPDLQKQQELASACADFENYTLQLQLASDGSITSAVAEVRLSSDRNLESLNMLNAGFTLDSFSLAGNPEKARLEYHGKLVLPYYTYTRYMVQPEIAQLGFTPGAYLADNLIFLQSRGEWHPYSLCVPDEVSLVIPENMEVNYTSVIQTETRNGLTTYYWKAPLPNYLIIANAGFSQIGENEAIRYIPEGSPSDPDTFSGTYLSLLEAARLYLPGMNDETITFIPLPLIKHSAYTPKNNTLIVPENSTWVNPYYRGGQNAALDILQAWWCRQEACTEMAYGLLRPSGKQFTSTMVPGEDPSAEELPDTTSLPLLYFAGMCLAEEAQVSEVDKQAEIESYRLIVKGELAIPDRLFSQDDQDTLLKLADFEEDYGSEAFWELFKLASEKTHAGWLDNKTLLELINNYSAQDKTVLIGEPR